jgi:hypothetical protein
VGAAIVTIILKLKCVKATLMVGPSSGVEFTSLEFEVVGQPRFGPIHDFLTIREQSLWKVQQFLDAAGFPGNELDTRKLCDFAEGVVVYAQVRDRDARWQVQRYTS